jgi:hypothetical protein
MTGLRMVLCLLVLTMLPIGCGGGGTTGPTPAPTPDTYDVAIRHVDPPSGSKADLLEIRTWYHVPLVRTRWGLAVCALPTDNDCPTDGTGWSSNLEDEIILRAAYPQGVARTDYIVVMLVEPQPSGLYVRGVSRVHKRVSVPHTLFPL